MVQWVKDFGLKVKSDRKTQVISGIVALCLIWLFFGEGARSRRPKEQRPVQVGANDPNERWQDLIERFNGQLNQLTSQTQANREDLDNLKKNMQDYESTTAEIFKKILERLAEVQAGNNGANGGSSPRSIGDIAENNGGPEGPAELEGLGASDAVPDAPPVAPKKVKLASIMPGDSVRIKLLAGVNAPTDGMPYPVVMKVTGDIQGPDGNSLPIGEARMIAAAQGSLTDQRVLFRLTRLSMRMPNGRRKEFAVDGWVVGEDGIRGMEGVLIDPIGKVIGAAGVSGFIGGVGQGIAQSNVRTRNFANGNQTSFINNNKIPEYAAGTGLSQSAYAWQQIIQQRAQQMVPVVQALSGREATAVFSQSLAIPDLLDQLDEEDPQTVFTSLD